MKHTLTFQGKKIGLSIACKKSTLYLCTNKENNFLKREDNRKHVNPLLYRGLFLFRACFAKKQRCFCVQRASSGAACEAPCRQTRRNTHLLASFRATRCPFSAVFDAPERFFVLLSYILPPTGQKDALAQNNNANTPRPKPSIRVETAPIPPRKPQKARRCGSVDGLFRRVGQRLPTFFISGCAPRS